MTTKYLLTRDTAKIEKTRTTGVWEAVLYMSPARERVTTARRRFRAACYAAQGTGQRRADIARTIAARTGVPAGALDTWPTVAFRPTAFSRRRGELQRLKFEAAVAAVDVEALLAELRAEGERLAAEMGVRV